MKTMKTKSSPGGIEWELKQVKLVLRAVIVGVLAGLAASHVHGLSEPWVFGGEIGALHYSVDRLLAWIFR